MNILFLGGNSGRHKAWIHTMSEELAGPFREVIEHDYKHWDTGESFTDINYEIAEIAQKVQGLEPFVVFAKSIGTVVAMRAMAEGLINPSSCVFLGVPLNVIKEMNVPFAEWLKETNTPIYFVQNEYDPLGSAEELRMFLPENINASKVVVLPGNTHDYTDTQNMSAVLSKCITN